MIKETKIDSYLHLRLVVGYLGEAAQFGWWSTSFIIPQSRSFLEPVFARTTRLAQYHGISAAARSLHDERIGVGNVFHLFRLPEQFEREMHEMATDRIKVENLFCDLISKEAALGALSVLADGPENFSEGPVSAGEIGSLFSNKVLKDTAHYYLAAFKQGVRTYPYFMGNRERE